MDYTINELSVLSSRIKPPTTFEEQIDLLLDRGLKFESRQQVLDLLNSVNYYYVSGYLHAFKNTDDTYKQEIDLKRLSKIISFDVELRTICMNSVDIIERCLKTKIAYHFANDYPYGNIVYIYPAYFDEKYSDDHSKLIELLNNSINNNKDTPYIRHHLKTYEGYIPIWVAIDLFTLGNLKVFYKIIRRRTQILISDEYGYEYRKIQNWINNLSSFRNMLAHNLRLYDVSLRYQTSVTASYPYNSNKIFDYILILKYLMLDKQKWVEFVKRITELFDKYSDFIDLNSIGFPPGWKNILLKPKDQEI